MDKKSITDTKSISKTLKNTSLKLVETWQKIFVHQLKVLMNLLKKHGTTQPEKVISVDEYEDVFFSLKINERAVYDDISFSVVKRVLHKALLNIFSLFLINSMLVGLHHCLREVKTMN